MLSRQLACEWGPHGIRSNVVSPGLVVTPMSQAFYDTPGVTERRTAVIPMRRIGAPQDMADAILFLASERASYINGDEIIVDGGFTRTIMNLVPAGAWVVERKCAVVSAKAGTHNHRMGLLKESRRSACAITLAAAYGSRIALRLSGTTA
jgi:hypothetical protein